MTVANAVPRPSGHDPERRSAPPSRMDAGHCDDAPILKVIQALTRRTDTRINKRRTNPQGLVVVCRHDNNDEMFVHNAACVHRIGDRAPGSQDSWRPRHLGLNVHMDGGPKMLHFCGMRRARPSSEELAEVMFKFPSANCIRVHLHVEMRSSSKSLRGLQERSPLSRRNA